MFAAINFASAEDIREYQEERLRAQIHYLSMHSPFYQTLFAKHDILPASIQTLADLKSIPTTSKNDLQQYNDDFFCVPKSEIIDYSTTSGTLGSPVTFGLTELDLERLAANEVRTFEMAGVVKGDLVQLMTTMDRRFMAGMAYFLGLRKLGAGIIRVGAGVPQLQWDSIQKFKPKFLIAVPSFLLKMIEFAENNGIDYKNSSVKTIICIGESLRKPDLSNSLLTQRILDKWKVNLHSTYASTEMSTAFSECQAFAGGHQQSDLIITELLDDAGNEVPTGAVGELVVTTLGIEGLPLLRFRTGDMMKRFDSPCTCGRNSLRLGPVEGRKQHLIKYKGTTVYPPAMHDLLASFDKIQLHLIELTSSSIGTDEITIKIAVNQSNEQFLQDLKDQFRAKLRVTPKIVVLPMEVLAPIIHNPLSRKPINFVDLRVEN